METTMQIPTGPCEPGRFLQVGGEAYICNDSKSWRTVTSGGSGINTQIYDLLTGQMNCLLIMEVAIIFVLLFIAHRIDQLRRGEDNGNGPA